MSFFNGDIKSDEIQTTSSIKIKEISSAPDDTDAYGQLWVKTATPNELYFTTDVGDDIQITSGTSMAGGGSSRTVSGSTNNGIITWVSSNNTFAAENGLTYDADEETLKLGASNTSRPILNISNSVNDDATCGILRFDKNRPESIPSINDNDKLGSLQFGSLIDGTNYDAGAEIFARVNGTPGSDDLPTELVFATASDGTTTATERMILNSSGNLTISKDTDGEFVALKLINQSDAADTTGVVSLEFDLEDTGGTAVDAGKIAVKKNEFFTATASTQDSNMVFSTSKNGTLTEHLTIDSLGRLYTSSGDKGHSSVGSGFNHTNSICNFYISKIGGEIITTILVDLTDLTYTTSTDSTSIIGKAATSSSYFYETSLTTNGIIYNLELICLEAPNGSSSPATNIGLHYNSSFLNTGVAVSNQKIIMNTTQSIGTKSEISFGESIASSATKLYFYGTSGSTSTYNAGQFLVKLYGAPTL